jgi:hypothetical protein
MKFFSKVMEIKSKLGELHFERYAIIETSVFSIYIHKIHKADKDPHLHSHPWNFVTLTLKGSYVEKYLSTDVFGEMQEVERVKKPLSFATANRNYFHKIETILDGPVTTLFATFGKQEKWYYLVNDARVVAWEYRCLKNSSIPNAVNESKFPKINYK